MSTTELKSNIHKIIDGIESEPLLRTLYDFLKKREFGEGSQFWGQLTEEQKQEVLLAFDESEDEQNLVSKEEVFGTRK
ncbi:hypothetical protein [Mariniradius sediminis]|uniref:Uncharacterized protein n=1 Tax=Mariniradius sediminis TaxID=2909237 RepID=A0ABS9BTG5_9BACT|nr:hypothetical protein [Mariniradius sediminis]MCF1750635.1 hypothetical protein [Mariniradius sediminis]